MQGGLQTLCDWPRGIVLSCTWYLDKGPDRIQIDTAYFTQTCKRYDTIRYSSLLLSNRYDTIFYQYDPNLGQLYKYTSYAHHLIHRPCSYRRVCARGAQGVPASSRGCAHRVQIRGDLVRNRPLMKYAMSIHDLFNSLTNDYMNQMII